MTFFVGKKKRRATDKEPVSVRSGRLCGAKATLCLKRRKQKKESHRAMKLFHGERIMASITHGRSLSVLRIWFMASLGQSRPLDMIRWSRTSSPNSDTPRILAEGHCLRASRSTLISSGRERLILLYSMVSL